MDNSCFGPLGRCKLLYSETSMVTTREGQLLLGQSFKKWKESNKRSSLFPFYLNSILQKYGEHYGDGVHIVFIMYQSIKSTISKFNGRRRFEAIEILDNILSTLHTYEHLFTKYMVSCDIWHSYPNVRYWCHDMFHCILLPAANSGVASKLTTFLMKWIFPVSSEIITAVSVLETCKRYRSDLSLFLFNSSTAAADAHKSHSSIDVLDQHEVLISGRCLDLSSINLKDQQHSIRHFICIHSLYASSIDDTVTLNLSSADALRSSSNQLGHDILRCCAWLKSQQVSLIFCGVAEEVSGTSSHHNNSDQQLLLLANCGLTVVDQVPQSHLRYLAERAGCPLHAHLLACLALSSSQPLGSHLTNLQPLLLGDHTHSRRLFYRLQGLRSSSSFNHSSISTGRSHTTQVVLFSSNSLTASTYRRLICRSLQAVEVALQCDTAGKVGKRQGEGEEGGLVVVPGAGAGELSWALLWRQVCECLQEEGRHGEAAFPTAPAASEEVTLSHRLRPLALFLSHTLSSGYTGLPETVVAVCESLSEAYQAVAGQLLLAAQQLLVTTSVPLRPPPHTSSILPAALQSAVSSPFSCSTLKLRQLWWLWLQQLEQGSSTLPVGRVGIVVHSDHHRKQQHSKLHRKSYNETMDRGDMDDDGFHTNESDVNDLGQFVDAALCSMDDPVACGVCTSHRHFWGGLLWLIGEAKVLLLLGGADYANSVLVVSAAKHRQWKDEMCSRKNIYEE